LNAFRAVGTSDQQVELCESEDLLQRDIAAKAEVPERCSEPGSDQDAA
jgi:hypothetical protein